MRPQRDQTIKACRKTVDTFARQPGDQVHVQMCTAVFAQPIDIGLGYMVFLTP